MPASPLATRASRHVRARPLTLLRSALRAPSLFEGQVNYLWPGFKSQAPKQGFPVLSKRYQKICKLFLHRKAQFVLSMGAVTLDRLKPYQEYMVWLCRQVSRLRVRQRFNHQPWSSPIKTE